MLFEPKVFVKRYSYQIEYFEKEPPKKGMILFYGDSGFAVWKNTPGYGPNPDLEEVITRKDGQRAAVNHGFGGSTAEEQLYYYHRAVKPWAPRVLVLQTFANDAASGYTPLEIFFLQNRLIDYARHDFPGINIYICNTLPRLSMKTQTQTRIVATGEYNELVKDYCVRHEDTRLIDEMNAPMFYKDPSHTGEIEYIREDLYIEDRVHLNVEGYKLYEKFIREQLKDEL
ncbi:MAG: hypothetical protein IJS65_06380 [Clostridia bacterium]|nr:hypothetical protein [Clostridia bacterium]